MTGSCYLLRQAGHIIREQEIVKSLEKNTVETRGILKLDKFEATVMFFKNKIN